MAKQMKWNPAKEMPSYGIQWEFTYDRKNRLKTYTNSNASNVRGNLWYDGQGRVWQRWNDNSGTSEWDATLTRFVYDGSALVQEHEFGVTEAEGEWEYTYDDLTRDYLRHAAGLRQRQRSGGSDTDYFMQLDQGSLEYKAERDPVAAAISRSERSSSLNQISGGTFQNISNLATSNNYVEMYGNSTSGFDPLVQSGSRHFLAGVEVFLTRRGNNPSKLAPAQVMRAAAPITGGEVMQAAEEDELEICEKWQCIYTPPWCEASFTTAACWYGSPDFDPDEGWGCFTDLTTYLCNGEFCQEGIQCPEDVDTCYSVNDYQEEWDKGNYCDVMTGTPCFINDPSLKRDVIEGLIRNLEMRIKIRDSAQRCVLDPLLQHCIKTQIATVTILCNCGACANELRMSCTNCNQGGICICTENIWNMPDLQPYYWEVVEMTLFHELVQWCTGCIFRRPESDPDKNRQFGHDIAACACERTDCYRQISELVGDCGRGESWQWTQENCGVCEGSGFGIGND